MTDFAIQVDELTIDWDHLLDNIPDLGFDSFEDPPPNPDSGCSLSIDDIEQYLLNDAAFLPESPPKDSSSSPDSFEVQQKESLHIRQDNVVEDNVEDDDSDDPASKKRKRKMRNRDAAMRSRERKKEYVRDLEMKSKYYEAECKRLGILLQNCLAENQVLRFSLHNSKAFDASMAKQESAVLLLELLLLGSLLGPLGIICLLILPSQFPSTLEKGLLGNIAIEEWGKVAPTKAGSDVFRISLPDSFMMGKRCKASRSRYRQAMENQEKVVEGLKGLGSSEQEFIDEAVMHLNGMKEVLFAFTGLSCWACGNVFSWSGSTFFCLLIGKKSKLVFELHFKLI